MSTDEPEKKNVIFCVKLSGAEISLECQRKKCCEWAGGEHILLQVGGTLTYEGFCHRSKNPGSHLSLRSTVVTAYQHLWDWLHWSHYCVTRRKTCLRQFCLFTQFGFFPLVACPIADLCNFKPHYTLEGWEGDGTSPSPWELKRAQCPRHWINTGSQHLVDATGRNKQGSPKT